MPLLALVTFFVTQLIVATLCTTFYIITTDDSDITGSMAMALIISSIINIVLMTWPLKMFLPKNDVKPAYIDIRYGIMAVCAALAGLFATNVAVTLCELSNEYEELMTTLSHTASGVIAIALIGPIAEEVVFRGAIMGYMLRKGIAPWIAIATSAIAFGIIHMNPIQIPFAIIAGIIFGVLYYKTGNILLSTFVHIVNNTIATYCANMETSSQESVITQPVIIAAVVAAFASATFLTIFWKKLSNPEYVPTIGEKETIASTKNNK